MTRDDGSISTNGFSNPASERDPSSVVSSPNRNSLISEDGSLPPNDQSQSPPRKSPSVRSRHLRRFWLGNAEQHHPLHLQLRQTHLSATSASDLLLATASVSGISSRKASVSICASSKHRTNENATSTRSRPTSSRCGSCCAKHIVEARAPTSRPVEFERRKSIDRRGQRLKSRGRVIGGDVTTGKTPAEVDSGSASDDDLGGCKLKKCARSMLLLTFWFRRLLRCRNAKAGTQGEGKRACQRRGRRRGIRLGRS